jgi:hypothetical protein
MVSSLKVGTGAAYPRCEWVSTAPLARRGSDLAG